MGLCDERPESALALTRNKRAASRTAPNALPVLCAAEGAETAYSRSAAASSLATSSSDSTSQLVKRQPTFGGSGGGEGGEGGVATDTPSTVPFSNRSGHVTFSGCAPSGSSLIAASTGDGGSPAVEGVFALVLYMRAYIIRAIRRGGEGEGKAGGEGGDEGRGGGGTGCTPPAPRCAHSRIHSPIR